MICGLLLGLRLTSACDGWFEDEDETRMECVARRA